MKSVLVIGLGRFGTYLIQKFHELNDDVLAIDIDENKVNSVIPYTARAVIGDCTNEDTIAGIGAGNFDVCFVCIGSNFQNSLEITSLLKEHGAKRVISKAGTNIHAKFLMRNGADEVIYPERDSAFKLASRYSADNVFDFIELTKNCSIYEVPIMPSWEGKSIAKLDIRRKYNINILALKENNFINALPSADYVFSGSEHMVMLCENDDAEKLLKKINSQLY